MKDVLAFESLFRLGAALCVMIPVLIGTATYLLTGVESHRNVPLRDVPVIKAAFEERYKLNMDESEGDRAMSYVERVIDRQINKIRGVLSFDAIVLALVSLELRRINADGALSDGDAFLVAGLLASGALVIAACLKCLHMFRVEVAQPAHFGTFKAEFNSTIDLIIARLQPLDHAVRLSWWAVVYITAMILVFEATAHLA